MALLDRLRDWLRPKPPTPPTPPPAPTPTDFLAQMLAAHNAERNKRSLPLLILNTQLVLAAQKHASWMDSHNNLSHRGAGGSQFDERLEAEGYRLRTGGENIAEGYPSVAAVMAGWMGSSGHKANILNSNYREVGFGKSGLYWCADFGTQLAVGEALPQSIFERAINLPGGLRFVADKA